MRIGALTTGRQDWGILRSTCLALREHPDFDFRLLVGGMHCSERHGRTEQLIEAESFAIAERLDWLGSEALRPGREAGLALQYVEEALIRQQLDVLMLVGDRFETAAAAMAATLCSVPIVHLHGGEETAGAFDNALRHAITKLSHLHLVSHEDHRARVLAMGETAESVFVVGAPGLDNLHRSDLPTRTDLEASIGIELEAPVVIVTVHPTTLASDPSADARAVATALDDVAATYVITLPNNDPGNETARDALVAAADRERRVVVDALGERRYWGLMRVADAIVGNSSSALIEAPAAQLPAVNVGDRQRGRVRGANVIDSKAEPGAIAAALTRALEPKFRAGLAGTDGPFGDGHSARRIVQILESWTPPNPPRKPPIPV